MKNLPIIRLFVLGSLLFTSCSSDDQQPAIVLFEEGQVVAETDTLLVDHAIAHRPGGAVDTTFFSYNASHQLTGVNSPGADYALEYDGEGRLAKMSWPKNEISYTWQGSRLISSAWEPEELPTQYYRYRYNTNFRLMVIERFTEAEMSNLQANWVPHFQEEDTDVPASPRAGEIAKMGLATYESGEHKFEGNWSYTDYDDTPSMQVVLDLMPAPDEDMQQGFSKLFPGRLFDRNIAAYRWEPAGLSDNPYIRMEYSHNSAGYVSGIEVIGRLASVEFVYQVVEK